MGKNANQSRRLRAEIFSRVKNTKEILTLDSPYFGDVYYTETLDLCLIKKFRHPYLQMEFTLLIAAMFQVCLIIILRTGLAEVSK